VSSTARQTLPGPDYHDPQVFALERERIFFRHWFYVGREQQVEQRGQWMRADVVGESVLLVRGKDGALRGFYNVCRHRGARLCEEESGQVKAAIRCPYHAWAYGLEGQLLTTPYIERDEIDHAATGLWPVHVECWQGFVFVNLSRGTPGPLRDGLSGDSDGPLTFERFRLDTLRTGHRTVHEVQANWKIVIENYNECLHCPTVHPELVDVIPAYRTGWVGEDGRSDGGVTLADSRTTLSMDPRSRLPLLPGMGGVEASSYFGAQVFPNMFLDVSGREALATCILPTGPTSTRLVTDYLFPAEAVQSPGFDPSAVVAFNDLVTQQDNDVCERVQRGVQSRAFAHGVFPAKDEYVYQFNQRYLAERDRT
jgi:glycine betaine catabolism A